MNWPMNVMPAVCVGLSRLGPGLRISPSGPAARSSAASMIPPGAPSCFNAAMTFGVG